MGAQVHDGWPQEQDEVEPGFPFVHHPLLCFACWICLVLPLCSGCKASALSQEKGTTANWVRMGKVDRHLVAYLEEMNLIKIWVDRRWVVYAEPINKFKYGLTGSSSHTQKK